ncbi:MAG: efflux RND transporter periplasmic adaptor subunit [Thermoanaerobaculia bacterium]
MKKILIILFVLVLALIILFSLKSNSKNVKEVYLEPLKKQNIMEIISASGEIQPKVKVNIQSDVIGRIEKLYFKEGDFVKKGQKLVELEKDTYLFQRDQAKAAIASALASLKVSEAQLEEAEAQKKRMEALLQENLVSKEVYDQVQANYKSALARFEASKEEINRLEKYLKEAEDKLKKTTILSPIDGKVVELILKEGEVVISGTPNIPGSTIAIVADLSDILAEVDVVESEIAKVSLGQNAKVIVDAFPQKELDGVVEEIGESAFKKVDVNYFKVKIKIKSDFSELKPGMTSKAKIFVEEKKDVLAVPSQAIQEKKGEKFIFISEKGKAKKVKVETGISDQINTEISADIKEGTLVVTGPVRVLKELEENMPIKEKKEDYGS